MDWLKTLATMASPVPIKGVTEETPLTTMLNPAGFQTRLMMADALMPKYSDNAMNGKNGQFNSQAIGLLAPLRGMMNMGPQRR